MKICVITGSRAEYGLLQPVMKQILRESVFSLQIIATGSHLSEPHGLTYKGIEQDGFRIDRKIPLPVENDSEAGITSSMAVALREFGLAFQELKPDWVLVLGDRFEIFAAVQAAYVSLIPIAHLAGGDITEGALDEAFRHSITKMAQLHFTTNTESARRVIQLGEDSRLVFNVGYTGLDHMRQLNLIPRAELEALLNFSFYKKNLLVTFHPATLDGAAAGSQCDELLEALHELGSDTGIFFTMPNADAYGNEIAKRKLSFVESHENARSFTSLGQLNYWSLLQQVDAVVGNSSSGLYEAPLLGKPSVNIGDRQKGRLSTDSVIHCPPEKEQILKSIVKALGTPTASAESPYGDGLASVRIVNVLKSIECPRKLLKKSFHKAAVPGSTGAYIIAEAGVNHNGSLDLAIEMIEAAKACGANAVKFQSFRAEELVTAGASKAEYQNRSVGRSKSQLEMLKELELTEEDQKRLARHCRQRGIDFMSSPFDIQSVDNLLKLGVRSIKIPSGEITNAPLLLRCARSNLPVILSTGMSTLKEIEEALAVLAHGYLHTDTKPVGSDLQQTFWSLQGRDILREKVTLLHCTTEYPAPYDEVNLLAMDLLTEVFNVNTGLSDHTRGISVALAAAARGAVVIEKHFTLDNAAEGPDHQASLEPQELKELVEGVRQIEKALGESSKKVTASESLNRPIARRSIVARKTIRSGEVFSEDNLAVKRPGEGISPMRYWDFLGKAAAHDYEKDEMIYE